MVSETDSPTFTLSVRSSEASVPMKWITVAAAAIGMCGLLLLAVHFGWFSAGPPNVIVISVDTLRPDHLGCYGYPAPTSPNIDRLMESAVRFDRAVSAIPSTTPSFCTAMTGAYPHTHGSLQNGVPLRPGVETLAEVFGKNGYHTAAFVSSFTVSNESSGLARGFDIFDDDLEGLERSSERTNERVFQFLDRLPRGSLFLWIHYFDPHAPYVEHPGIPVEKFAAGWPGPVDMMEDAVVPLPPWVESGKGLAYYGMCYDGEIAFVDGQIGILLDELRTRGLLNRALVVFLADHGESFDHGLYCRHGPFIYDSSVRIPLGFVFPEGRFAGRTVEAVVENVDVAPTICDFLDIPPPDDSEGKSLLPLLSQAGESDGEAFIQRRHYSGSHREKRLGLPHRLYALRTRFWKYLRSDEGDEELYDLAEDPGELHNLARIDTIRAKEMGERLGRWIEQAEVGAPEDVPLDRETQNRLKSLGYLQ